MSHSGAPLLTSALVLYSGLGLGVGCTAEPAFEPEWGPAQPIRTASGERGVIIGGDTVILPRSSQPGPGLGLGLSGRHVLFLNMEGADVRPGSSNAMENTGIRGMGSDEPVVEMAPYSPGKADRWKDVLDIQRRVAGFYADMNLDVVISRPLTGDYMMTVIGGPNTAVGYSGGIVGISPGDCRNNNELDMDYAFSANLGEAPAQSALTAAHEAGHAFGLGHTLNMQDIMYPSVSPATGFNKGEVADPGPCGAHQGDIQDSHQVLIDNLGARSAGPRPGEGSPPTVSFLSPAEAPAGTQATMVPADLTVAIKAAAALGLDRVSISVSKIGDKGQARGGHPIAELRPPASAARVKMSAPGEYLLIATAYDVAGNVGVAQTKVAVGAVTCQVPNDCAPGQRCQAGACLTPPLPADMTALRDYGSACNDSAECEGGICAATPVGQICTHYCNTGRLCATPDLSCVDGICLPPIVQRTEPKIGQLGGKCTRNQDCGSGECSAADLNNPTAPRYCTKICDAELAWTCPGGMVCQLTDGASGMKQRCIKDTGKPADPGGGGCDVSRGGTSGLWAAALSVLLIALRRRRARG